MFAEELVQLLREVRHAKVGPLRFRANTLRKEGRHAEAAATHAEADALVAGILRRAAEATRHREHCTPQPASSLRVPHRPPRCSLESHASDDGGATQTPRRRRGRRRRGSASRSRVRLSLASSLRVPHPPWLSRVSLRAVAAQTRRQRGRRRRQRRSGSGRGKRRRRQRGQRRRRQRGQRRRRQRGRRRLRKRGRRTSGGWRASRCV